MCLTLRCCVPVVLVLSLHVTVSAQSKPAEAPPAVGAAYHPPVFQRGNELAKPLAPNDPMIGEFVKFFSQHTKRPLPMLTAKDIISFPSQRYDKASWHLGGGAPYVTFTENAQDTFVTSDNCKNCHDAVQTLAIRPPRMTVKGTNAKNPAEPLLANLSEYGEWSASLMALSARDPVFHAQVETERNQHDGVDPTLIDNVCYSCHGAMGQKQITAETNGKGMFNHYMIYSTPDNFHPTGYPYDKPGADPKFSRIAALARDGLSCELCHHIGPGKTANGSSPNWTEFYGHAPEYAVRETTGQWANERGFSYPFTSTFKYNLKQLIVPDKGVDQTEEPMHLLGMAKAADVNYIKRSELCGTCHVVIVPKIPPGYKRGAAPIYTPPDHDPSVTTYSGNPFSDPLLNLAYEQTTYLEYLNSTYPVPQQNPGSEGLTTVECQTCHMPGIEPPKEQVSSIGPAWYSPNVTYEQNGHKVRGTPNRVYTRHRLLGINLFVSEMFQQFHDILGLSDPHHDPETPPNVAAGLLNAEQSIVQHAKNGPQGHPTADTEIVAGPVIEGNALNTTVRITNYAGHTFSSGAGFRRGFIEFRVVDATGKTLWVSGATNQFGVIVGPDGQPLPSKFAKTPDELQPHWQTIQAPTQVQIYQVNTMDGQGQLTSQTLSLFKDVKDNRLMPNSPLKKLGYGARQTV